jgi:hypothetical protein
MATENPKVSGYVPQEIFDCLLEFKEKRSLKSVSLALTVVLSEYFQVEQKVDRQSSLLSGNDFVSREQFESLENKLSELNSNLLSELDRLVGQRFSSLRNELLSSPQKSIEVQTVNVESELFGEPLNEPEIGRLPSELKSSPPQLELEIADSVAVEEKDLDAGVENFDSEHSVKSLDFVLVETSISYLSLSGQCLSKRLNVAASALSGKKKELSEQEFYDWLQSKDPDKISWQPAGGDLKKRVSSWIPTKDTPSELLGRLKEWVDTNPE